MELGFCMDENKHAEQTEQKDYRFIRETIVKKQKSRIKRIALLGAGVVLMAILFGVVSRVCFILSEPLANRLLGITPSAVPTQPQRNTIVLPSQQEQPTTALEPSHIEIVQPDENDTKEPTKDDAGIDKDGTEEGTKPEVTELADNSESTLAGIRDYVAIYQEIRRVATNAASAMATITVTDKRKDWFEQEYEESTTLTGVIVGDNNVELLILTEASALLNAETVKVTVGGYTTEETVLFSSDENYNLAVIGIDYASIPAENLERINYAVFGESYSLFVGTPVIAVGNPNGYVGSFELGTVTARNSFAYIADNRLGLFNTSIPDYENGSGFIINTAGEIMGMITHAFKEDKNKSLNTVIGISRLKPVIQSLVNGLQMNYFGVVAEELTEEQQAQMRSKIGIVVTKVLRESPAEQAGIREGDVLLIIEKTPMNSAASLRTLLDESEEGAALRVILLRKGAIAYSEQETTVTVRKK